MTDPWAELLADLGPIERFPTVDEMHVFVAEMGAAHPDLVTVAEVGRSRGGDAIQLLSITPPDGAGAAGAVLVVGQPHPNEPIGMATIVTLCERLLSNRAALQAMGVSWHFVPCVDPDGTRLNEGWFGGPWTREHYARHFFRPASDAQVEWTFPFSTEGFSVAAPLPETLALMAAIDRVRPQVLSSLHNGEMGGAYFYAEPGADDLYPRLASLCADHAIPLHCGEAETPVSTELAPAVYSVPTAQQLFDLAASVGIDPSAIVTGASSHEYAQRHGPTFGVVVELPYWRDARADDVTPDRSGHSRRDVVLASVDLQETSVARIRAMFDAARPLPPSPFKDAVEGFLKMAESGYAEAERQQARDDPGFDRPATVAEVFGGKDNVHAFRLRLGGMLLRALPADAPTRAEVEETFDGWCAESAADNQSEAIPIADLVAVQGGAILATARHVFS